MTSPGFPTHGIICLMGMDGAGKSTVIAKVNQWLNENGVSTKIFHTHDYNIPSLKKLNAIGQETFIRKFHFLFYFWPIVALADHCVTYRRKFHGGNSLLLTDRYFYDKYVRFRFWRIAFPGLFYLYKWLIPKPWRIILLDVPTEIAVQRKGEYSSADYDVFRREYLRFAKLMASHVDVVNAAAPLDHVVESVKQCLNNSIKERSLVS